MPPEIQTQISSENEVSAMMEKAMRMAEIERKRLELRKRMEEASKARRAKKSFMTPERKKKLRLLLRKKAAEELKKEQERKAEERRWTIEERCGEPEDTEWSSKEDLIDICEYYYQRILDIESEKWDIELDIRRKHFEIIDINSKVNDLRGKFQRPILKKVSKFENKFAKLQRKAAEYNFRNQLKLVRRHEFILKDDDRRSVHSERRHCQRLPRMSSRCASCHYPLSVCDSVACRECKSYFHINCAQLVGFPLFELSAEPTKNIFHCSTCQLLPLPVPRGDSDNSDDEGMPTRQLDYTLEGDSGSGKNMNEVKGTIQDLSDLCKDMLREINDLKSINLTLRCCVENLRHDNEERDNAIIELKRRLDLLEGIKVEGKNFESFNQSSENCIKNEIESTQEESNESLTEKTAYNNNSAAYKHELFSKYTTTSKEETEGYELEETTPTEEIIGNLKQNTSYNQQSAANKKELFSNYITTSKEETEGYELEETSSSIWDTEEDPKLEKWDSENEHYEEADMGYSDVESDNETQTNKSIDQTKELVNAEFISETKESRKDWSWKGSQAVEISKEDDESEEEEDESEEEIDETETPSWKKLKEEIESAIKEDDDVKTSTETKAIDTEEKEESWKMRKSVTWDENIQDESETDTEFSQRGLKHDDQSEVETETIFSEDVTDEVGSVTDVDDRYGEEDLRLESREDVIEEEDRLEAEEVFSEEQPTLEASEVLAEGEARLEIDRPITDGEPTLEGDVTVDGYGEPRVGGDVLDDVEPRLEGDVLVDSEPKLEGDLTVDGEPRLEGDLTLEGEPALDGEAIVDEEPRMERTKFPDEEEVQLPESPPPEHTEEDLWLYLRENVSSEHPSTVEEFVKNLIGTLQHVPQEYLKPVIDANIKRANSPSVTDGEHLPTPEGQRSEEGEVAEEGSNLNSFNPLETTDSPVIDEDFPASTQEVPFPGGSSALEATD